MSFHKSYFIILFFIIGFNSFSQETFKNEAERIKYANKLFENQKFIEAEPHMLSFLSNKNNSEYNFKYGVCVLFKYADKSKAIPYLKKAVKDAKVDPRAYFYLGRVYHYNYLFQDALNNYKKYESLANPKQASSLNLNMYVNMCQNGQSLMKNLSDIIVIDKKSTALDKFNYSYDLKDIGGRILPTEEFQSKLDKKRNHKPIIYFPSVNDILFYSSYGESGENGLDIYFRKWLSSGTWSEAKLLPSNINSSYNEDFPFLNADGTTFYFCSKGHNSMGGYDIFRCNFDPSTNDFGPISNLDYKINSTDDDILYLVDKNNENAIFSSKRSSPGDKIDVYNVKVKVLPLQNIIIAGSFKNSIITDDIEANIKVQDVRNNKLIASYTVSKDGTYQILLPNSGKYKFIVETPKSEKIHAGLVEAPPQEKLKALKQEIELIRKDGQEKLIIKDYFDQSPENEDVIIANLLKKMSEPQINIDQFPDSILNKLTAKEETTQTTDEIPLVKQDEEITSNKNDSINEIIDFTGQKEQLIESKKQSINEIRQQNLLVQNIAKLKTEESQELAQKAADILLEIESDQEDSIIDQKLKKAAEYNLKSQLLNEQASSSILLSKTLEQEIEMKKKQIETIATLNSQDDFLSDSNNLSIVNIQKELNNPNHKEKSPLQTIRSLSKIKEQEAENHATKAQNLRSDQESIVFQIEKEQEILNNTKKKKVIEQQNIKISELKRKQLKLDAEIENEFSLYEKSEIERKNLVKEADNLEKISVSKDYKDLTLEENIDVNDLAETNNSVRTELIEKNNPQLEEIYVEIKTEESTSENAILNNTNELITNENTKDLDNKPLENNSNIIDNSNLVANESQNTIDNSFNIDTTKDIENSPVDSSIQLAVNENNISNSRDLDSSNGKSTSSAASLEIIEENQAIEFVENLPINIPVVKDFEEVPSTTVNGVVFDSKSDPDSYQVLAIVDENIQVTQNQYENETNNKIIEINKKNIDKIKSISAENEELELQKLDVTDEKQKSKIDKKILKLNKKKAKAQLKIADDMAFVNEKEINHINNELSSTKKQTFDVSPESFKLVQGKQFESAAVELIKQSEDLRNQASNEQDKIKKGKLIDEAIQNENTAINYLKKSKKLYSDAIIEDFSNDKLTIAKSLNPTQTKQSVKFEKLADIALAESKNYSEKAKQLREDGNILEAVEFENLAKTQKNKSSEYKEQSLDYKEMEIAMVKEIELSKTLVEAEVVNIASTEEFQSYYENEKSIQKLEKENQKLKVKKQGYNKVYNQLNAKSEALIQQSKKETDPIKKNQLLKDSKLLSKEAAKIKGFSEAIVYSIDSVKRVINNKEMEQAMVLEVIDDSSEVAQIQALAISGMADSVLALLPDEVAEEIEALDTIAIDSTNISAIEENLEEPIDEIISDNRSLNQEDVFSKDFVPPTIIKESIFFTTEREVYSDDNPIPINPKLPKGLIFKIQVGAFRNPIPQNLFKGFAPISAEIVRDDITRYRVGYFKSYSTANQAKNQVRALSNSYRDAFVVALNNGERITLSEARSLQQNFSVETNEEIAEVNSNSLNDLRNLIANDNTLAEVITVNEVDGLFYSVQIGAFSKPLLKENNFNLSPLIVSRINNLYKYSTGQFPNIELAASKKSELLNEGILKDAFIIAYNNGRNISLTQANSVNPNRVVEYKNPTIYYINFGTYVGEFPEILNPGNLEMREYNIKSRARYSGRQFFSKKYNSLSEAQIALNAVPNTFTNSKIVKSSRDDFIFNYEYKVELGIFEDLTEEIKEKIDNLKNLEINAFKKNGNQVFYTKSRDDKESVTSDLNLCKTQGFNEAKITVFKDGVETTLKQIQKSFK